MSRTKINGRMEMFLFNDIINTFHLQLYGIGHIMSRTKINGIYGYMVLDILCQGPK